MQFLIFEGVLRFLFGGVIVIRFILFQQAIQGFQNKKGLHLILDTERDKKSFIQKLFKRKSSFRLYNCQI